MRIKLTADGQRKYRKARGKLRLSNGKLYQLGSETSTRGEGIAPSDARLAERLGGEWYGEKVNRFFNSNPRYPVYESEARDICKVLGIVFDLNDYEEKQGTTLDYLPFLKQTGPSGKRLDLITHKAPQPSEPAPGKACKRRPHWRSVLSLLPS
jgi:hypothetical protein